jgi:lon-related putative ATP-dependent protease
MKIRDNLRVDIKDLKNCCSLGNYNFETTDSLEKLSGIIGQDRAKEALEVGLDIKKKGFNIYVAGQWGTGRTTFVKELAELIAKKEAIPSDYIYANDFEDQHNTIAISVEAGESKVLIGKVYRTISFLRKEIENHFISKEYENKKKQIFIRHKKESSEILLELNEIGKVYDFQFKQSEKGIVSIPLLNGESMSEDEYNDLTDEQYDEMKDNSEKLQVETADLFNKIREVEKGYRKNIIELNKSLGQKIVSYNFLELRSDYKDNESVNKYLELLENDIVKHINEFINHENPSEDKSLMLFKAKDKEVFFDRYKLNHFVDNSELKSAPVIFESNPTYQNLLGSIEFTVDMGVRKTDFRHIKNGALHRANGGYLIVLAKDILSNPFAWKGIKRALLDEEIIIESMSPSYSVFSAATIRPEPIPLKIKVIIIGTPRIYHLLANYDEEFAKLFKIRADFDSENIKNDKNILKMAQFISSFCSNNEIRHLKKNAVERIIDYSSREVENKNKISARLKTISDILIEADTIANNEKEDYINENHIQVALDRRERRDNRYEEAILEYFEDGTYLLNVDGARVGEINGLAVISTGQHSFGKPNRITVSTYKGKAGIINIEREVETSGSVHDKGVLILSGYLGFKFAQDRPLAFTASIVFEQLYGGIDGDSASSTELYALLSSLSGVPIKQAIAVTGSVNQRGEVQPIGGINEKIEGFYKICKLKGLNGNQGVMMPIQNVKNLVLNDEVVEAIKNKQFSIYAISHIDEGIEILTGIEAGKRNSEGMFPEGTINYLVSERLTKLGEYDEDSESMDE